MPGQKKFLDVDKLMRHYENASRQTVVNQFGSRVDARFLLVWSNANEFSVNRQRVIYACGTCQQKQQLLRNPVTMNERRGLYGMVTFTGANDGNYQSSMRAALRRPLTRKVNRLNRTRFERN